MALWITCSYRHDAAEEAITRDFAIALGSAEARRNVGARSMS